MAVSVTRAVVNPAAGATPRGTPPAFALVADGWESALLDCDFDSSDEPELVTRVLEAFLCAPGGGPAEPLELWNLPVGARLLALLWIVAALDDADGLTLTLRCRRPGCRAAMESALGLSDLAALQGEHSGPEVLALSRPDGRAVTLRRPTGEDLRRWHAAAPADVAAIEPAMLRDLVTSGDLPADSAPMIDALDAADPLIAFTVVTTCPACGHRAEHPVDLEALGLRRLRERQAGLVAEIHELARAYGWTESETLAVPEARRARYRALIDASSSP